MKKISFKKVAASVAALSLVAFGAAIPASAATYETAVTTSSVYIEQVTVSVEEAQAGVPVYVYVNNAFSEGLTSFEFGIQVDQRVKRTVVNDAEAALELGGKALTVIPEKADSNVVDNFTWVAGASAKNMFAPNAVTGAAAGPKAVLMIYCKIDDPQPGEKYEINSATLGVGIVDPKTGEVKNRDHLFKNGNIIDYVAASNVNYVDGWIQIEGEPETTATTEATTVATTTATTVATTVATTEATTVATTEATTVATTEATTVDTGNTTNTNNTTNTAETTNTAASTSGAGAGTSNGSPATGASDVLPIAGAAAAVALLGGVALVAKKKND